MVYPGSAGQGFQYQTLVKPFFFVSTKLGIECHDPNSRLQAKFTHTVILVDKSPTQIIYSCAQRSAAFERQNAIFTISESEMNISNRK